MEMIKKQRKSVAVLIITVFLLTSVFSSLGVLALGLGSESVSAADTSTTSSGDFNSPDYVAENFGLEDDHVFDTLGYGRTNWLFRQDGFSLIAISSPLHDNHSVAMKAIDKAAQTAGVGKIYNLDVYATGQYGHEATGYGNITETPQYKFVNYGIAAAGGTARIAANNENATSGMWHHTSSTRHDQSYGFGARQGNTNNLSPTNAVVPRLYGLLPAQDPTSGSGEWAENAALFGAGKSSLGGWTAEDVILLMYSRTGLGTTDLLWAEAQNAIVGYVVLSKADLTAAAAETGGTALFDGLVSSVSTMLTTTKTTIDTARGNTNFVYGAAMVEDPDTLIESFPNSETRFTQWQYFSSWGTASGDGHAEVVGRRPITADHKDDFRLVQVPFGKLLWLHDQEGTRYYAQNAAW